MKGFIFDFDGVIVDSEKYWAEMDEAFFPMIAPGYTDDHTQQMMGLGRKAGYDFLVRKLGMECSYDDYCVQLEKGVQVIYETKTQLLPGVRTFIESLHNQGIALGIASSSREQWIKGAIERFELSEFFRAISTADHVDERTKPLPDVYLHAADQLKIQPNFCIAIEDSRNGITAAKAAGMVCIGLRTEMNPTQDLSAADVIVKNFEEIDLNKLWL